jgi:hypothetical protein
MTIQGGIPVAIPYYNKELSKLRLNTEDNVSSPVINKNIYC